MKSVSSLKRGLFLIDILKKWHLPVYFWGLEKSKKYWHFTPKNGTFYEIICRKFDCVDKIAGFSVEIIMSRSKNTILTLSIVYFQKFGPSPKVHYHKMVSNWHPIIYCSKNWHFPPKITYFWTKNIDIYRSRKGHLQNVNLVQSPLDFRIFCGNSSNLEIFHSFEDYEIWKIRFFVSLKCKL